ncbi:hypothetical protein [Halorussus amylolyticus]|uniref:hypothetical protein n=1 Tax=Halorussus amylolyticus TaxID=1126242 RepID=UPI001048414F|nr:hypothetical protein [Halorussus amylolyticus]
MADRPGRQTDAARSRRRRGWDGDSLGSMVEKDRVGVFLDDVAYVFADVSISSIPILYVVLTNASNEWYGVKASAAVAWAALVVVGTLIRGGWIRPLATDAPGWVSLAPWLLAFRLVYFNAALALAAYGGGAVNAAWSSGVSVGFAAAVGALSAGAFPRLAEAFYRGVSN